MSDFLMRLIYLIDEEDATRENDCESAFTCRFIAVFTASVR